MNKVTSKDGTTIAYDQLGSGPALILVTGAFGVRRHPIMAQLAELLSPHFTVIYYDRRGRGDSGDSPSYAVEREVEDIEALIDAAGGSAFLAGSSSGSVLALEAVARLPDKVKKLVMYEPPFVVDDSRPPVGKDFAQRLNALIAEGRRGDAVELFMTEAVGVPPEFVAQMRSGPGGGGAGERMTPPEWVEMEQVAHTLAYDSAIMGETMSGKPLPAGRWSTATAPTLVISGGNSPPFFHNGAQALVALLPDAEYRILEGQDHAVSPDALAPVLVEFFAH